MSYEMRREVLPKMRERYHKRNREGKGRIIDELEEVYGYSRKHAIKLMSLKAGRVLKKQKSGRPREYGEEEEKVLKVMWRVSEQPCGKRLKEMIGIWLPYYEKRYGKIKVASRKKLLKISASQIDRILSGVKVRWGKGRSGTKPGGLLKNQIPIRTDNWDIKKPGYLEADTVAHCGNSLEGDFIWSVTYTDIYSGWTSNRAIWNKGSSGVLEATRDVEKKLPFELLGFDCDNGSEFLNYHLLRYFQEREKVVGFTRSRPYHKNDNGHVEQKNWSHVRQLLGYERLGNPELLEGINKLYKEVWEPLNNFFMPSSKLIKKDRHGAKIKRRHDKAMTPCDRLLESPDVSASTKRKLRATRKYFDPFTLHDELEKNLQAIFKSSLHSSRLTGSLHFESF